MCLARYSAWLVALALVDVLGRSRNTHGVYEDSFMEALALALDNSRTLARCSLTMPVPSWLVVLDNSRTLARCSC